MDSKQSNGIQVAMCDGMALSKINSKLLPFLKNGRPNKAAFIINSFSFISLNNHPYRSQLDL